MASKKNKPKKQSKIYFIAGLFLIGVSIYFMVFFNMDAFNRMHTEEDIADQYVNDLLTNSLQTENNNEESTPTKEVKVENIKAPVQAEEIEQTEYTDDEGGKHIENIINYSFTDENYFIGANGTTYTPDYAFGSLFCVLEYEKIGIRRGVYQGTIEESQKNQDMWIPNLGHLLQNFGYTQITIEAHNHTVQGLSFNRLNEAALGDTFILYGNDGVYEYNVTDIFAITRDDERRALCNDFEMGKDKCFLVTCGRDNFLLHKFKYYNAATHSLITYKESEAPISSRYYDYIVEGTLKKKHNIDEYAEKVLKDENAWKEKH